MKNLNDIEIKPASLETRYTVTTKKWSDTTHVLQEHFVGYYVVMMVTQIHHIAFMSLVFKIEGIDFELLSTFGMRKTFKRKIIYNLGAIIYSYPLSRPHAMCHCLGSWAAEIL